MNSLRLVSLQINNTNIHFKDGPNYIVGNNSSGKTTIFNCIKYALGLTKSMVHRFVNNTELNISINDCNFEFKREVGSPHLSISHKGRINNYRALSIELDEFLKNILSPNFIFGSETESVLALLDFCFLSEERSVNRRQQWEAMNSICGINVSLLKSVEMDIYALKKEVSKNKEIENSVDDFSRSLTSMLNDNENVTDVHEKIALAKEHFFDDFRKKEHLLIQATSKLEEIKERSDSELMSKLLEIEDVFLSINQYNGFERRLFDGLEAFIKDRSKTMSYGEETFSRFILVLAIAKVAQESRYNFPQLIINDSFLAFDLDKMTYKRSLKILDEQINRNRGLQYIEFTHKDDVPREHVVLNLNAQGGLNVFDS